MSLQNFVQIGGTRFQKQSVSRRHRLASSRDLIAGPGERQPLGGALQATSGRGNLLIEICALLAEGWLLANPCQTPLNQLALPKSGRGFME